MLVGCFFLLHHHCCVSAFAASIVTGASGYVGKAVVHELLLEAQDKKNQKIICLVRPARVDTETAYWKDEACVSVEPYDMMDGGDSLRAALNKLLNSNDGHPVSICVYHIASWFSPSDNHVQMAKENVQGTEDLVKMLGQFPNCKLVVTSSMAAVRATSQDPVNGNYYTKDDWNTVSALGANWGASYQWSKTESERRAWALSKELDIPMVALCPSFVFGPPASKELSRSFSTELVGQWIKGESEVQSRLFVDVRDVAQAHVAAGTLPNAVGKRYIVSTEERLASKRVAEILKDICREENFGGAGAISYDSNFSGGAIAIGEKEVEAEARLKEELGITLRSPQDTVKDMGKFLIKHSLDSLKESKQ